MTLRDVTPEVIHTTCTSCGDSVISLTQKGAQPVAGKNVRPRPTHAAYVRSGNKENHRLCQNEPDFEAQTCGSDVPGSLPASVWPPHRLVPAKETTQEQQCLDGAG